MTDNRSNGTRQMILGIGLAIAAGAPAAIMAIENTTVRALLMVAAGLAFFLLGVLTPIPRGLESMRPPSKSDPPATPKPPRIGS